MASANRSCPSSMVPLLAGPTPLQHDLFYKTPMLMFIHTPNFRNVLLVLDRNVHPWSRAKLQGKKRRLVCIYLGQRSCTSPPANSYMPSIVRSATTTTTTSHESPPPPGVRQPTRTQLPFSPCFPPTTSRHVLTHLGLPLPFLSAPRRNRITDSTRPGCLVIGERRNWRLASKSKVSLPIHPPTWMAEIRSHLG